MSIKQLLESLASTAAGPQPSFQSFQILDALLIIDREAPIGRKKLSEKLGLGEGAVRTLLQKLKSRSLIDVRGKGGCILSEKGRMLISKLRSKLIPVGSLAIDLPWSYPENYAIIVRDSALKLRRGLEQRDEAIRAGAKALLILSYLDGRLLMPSVSDLTSEKPEFAARIIELVRPRNGDVILIAGGDTEIEARRGALAAAQTLL
ncbi:MAG: hypothetical protein DRN59_03415 [Thaumarchaeota archaeon]|nr:MAG: hypothetical protein DRN59_03415 [Nitrososphaerota archaeon]